MKQPRCVQDFGPAREIFGWQQCG